MTGRPALTPVAHDGSVMQLRSGAFWMDASMMANTYLLVLDDRVFLVDPGPNGRLNPLVVS